MKLQEKGIDLTVSCRDNVQGLVMMTMDGYGFHTAIWLTPDELSRHAAECQKLAEVCRKACDSEGNFVRGALKSNFKTVEL